MGGMFSTWKWVAAEDLADSCIGRNTSRNSDGAWGRRGWPHKDIPRWKTLAYPYEEFTTLKVKLALIPVDGGPAYRY